MIRVASYLRLQSASYFCAQDEGSPRRVATKVQLAWKYLLVLMAKIVISIGWGVPLSKVIA